MFRAAKWFRRRQSRLFPRATGGILKVVGVTGVYPNATARQVTVTNRDKPPSAPTQGSELLVYISLSRPLKQSFRGVGQIRNLSTLLFSVTIKQVLLMLCIYFCLIVILSEPKQWLQTSAMTEFGYNGQWSYPRNSQPNKVYC